MVGLSNPHRVDIWRKKNQRPNISCYCPTNDLKKVYFSISKKHWVRWNFEKCQLQIATRMGDKSILCCLEYGRCVSGRGSIRSEREMSPASVAAVPHPHHHLSQGCRIIHLIYTIGLNSWEFWNKLLERRVPLRRSQSGTLDTIVALTLMTDSVCNYIIC